MKRFFEHAWNRLTAPHDLAGLVVFRIVLGSIVAVSAFRFLVYGWVEELFTRPRFHFSYWGFEWLPHLPATGMKALFVAVLLLGLCVAAGAFYRVSTVLLFFAFTYLQLWDVTNYLNHYYLVSLLTLLLAVVPGNAAFSLDAWLWPSVRRTHVPAAVTYLFRFQVGTVYVFAGLAKLNSDWLLHAQPLSIWLSARTGLPVIGPLLSLPGLAFAAAWFGFLFDTTVPFFLSWRKTRALAYAAVVFFHGLTSVLFPIGMFPVIMVVAASVFFDPSWPRRWLRRWTPSTQTPSEPPPRFGARHGVLTAIALLYAVTQWAIPLRAHAYGGNVSWHEQGMRFSWRVMSREKNGEVLFWVRDRQTDRRWYVSPRAYLTSLQEREMSVQPDLIWQLAQRIARDFRAKGHPDVEVTAEAQASLNGRPQAVLISPDVDLSRVPDDFSRKGWIAPAPDESPPRVRVTQRGDGF
jgi:vitamin K-dependent gamma-carboxylase